MKKILTLIISLVALTCILSSCVSSDEATEKMLDGKWETSYTESEAEVYSNVKETLTLDALTHTSTMKISISVSGYGEYMHLGSVSMEGKWKASKDMIEFDWNTSSVEINMKSSVIREMFGSKKELKKALEEETGLMDLKNVTEDSFTVVDAEDEEITYTRK